MYITIHHVSSSFVLSPAVDKMNQNKIISQSDSVKAISTIVHHLHKQRQSLSEKRIIWHRKHNKAAIGGREKVIVHKR